MDQINLTEPSEVLSRIPDATYRLYGKTVEPVRDVKGLCLVPDAALGDAAKLRGDASAQAIQLQMVYAPEPPFDAGTPETVPPAILAEARDHFRDITARRETSARRIAAQLRVPT